MVRQSPGSLAETALESSFRLAEGRYFAPASDVSAQRVVRAKTRPIVGCCQILRRHIHDISNSRGCHFLPRFRTLGEVSCVARLQLSLLFLNSPTCTCSFSRFHGAVRDPHLNARTRTLRATALPTGKAPPGAFPVLTRSSFYCLGPACPRPPARSSANELTARARAHSVPRRNEQSKQSGGNQYDRPEDPRPWQLIAPLAILHLKLRATCFRVGRGPVAAIGARSALLARLEHDGLAGVPPN